MNHDRRSFLAAAAAIVTGLERNMLGLTQSTEAPLAGLRHANAWLNSPPLTAASLSGKVVLVNFCTYTCINWLRSFPYVRAWAEKYKEHGLVVIGAHTPEFAFEHELDNVRRGLAPRRIGYPIAVDNDYGIWNAFDNNAWPAVYLVDGKGVVRHQQLGEGAYEQTERVIQRLLMEAGATGIGSGTVTPDAPGIEAPADWDNLATPETYTSSAKAEHYVSTRVGNIYTPPARLKRNEWALAGGWRQDQKSVKSNAPNGKILFEFHARDVHLVMGPATKGGSVRYRVSLDGKPPGAAHGTDVDEHGEGTLNEQRTYQLIRQSRPIVDRQFEIAFFGAGAEAFCFTFG